jgi:hypothetical protein
VVQRLVEGGVSGWGCGSKIATTSIAPAVVAAVLLLLDLRISSPSPLILRPLFSLFPTSHRTTKIGTNKMLDPFDHQSPRKCERVFTIYRNCCSKLAGADWERTPIQDFLHAHFVSGAQRHCWGSTDSFARNCSEVCVFLNALFVSIHKRTSVSRSIEALAVPHMYMIPSCWSYQEKELSRRILLVFSLVPC